MSDLKNGDSIYESACGRGSNLLSTLHVLRDECGINVTAHGSDDLSLSIAVAQQSFTDEKNFCQADSTNISYINNNTFDLSFTGYIDPIIGADQKLQEQWYEKWIVELVRVTKKGKPIVIESVSYSKREDPEDWGGVSPTFFGENANRWGVHNLHIMLMPRTEQWTFHRYHVFMMKDE